MVMENVEVVSVTPEPVSTISQYLLSNGTRVVSNTAVNFYTQSEILKIEVAGGILVIAVLVITYALYRWWNIRYKTWLKQQELEDRIERGETPDPTEYPPPPEGVNKVLLYIVGGLIICAGIAIMVMP